MKLFHCHSHSFFSLRNRRLVHVGEEYDSSLVSAAESVTSEAEKSEINVNVGDYNAKAAAAMDGVISGIVTEKKRAVEARITDLTTKIETEKNPAKKQTLQTDLETAKQEKDAIGKNDGDFQKALAAAKERALGKVKGKVEAANKAREDRAKEFAEQAKSSLAAQLATASQKERSESPKAKWSAVEIGLNVAADFISIPMPNGAQWDEAQCLEMATEAIQTIYIEQGPEAANAKVETMKKNLLHNAVGQDDVTYETFVATFGGDGGFTHVLDKMGIDPKLPTSPKLMGHVIGKMTAAADLFTGDNQKYLVQYEAYVQAEIKKNRRIAHDSDLMSPTEWAKNNAPEAIVKPADRRQLIDQVLDRIKLPPEDPKDKYEAAEKRRATMNEYLMGLLNGETDSKKWDGLVKSGLEKMLGLKEGADIDFNQLNTFDFEKQLDPGDDMLGDSNGPLKGWSRNRAFIAGMIDAAVLGYKGKKVMVGGKEKDFAEYYREHIKQTFADGGPMFKAIREAKDAFRDAKDEVRGRNPRLSPDAEAKAIHELEIDFHNAVSGALQSDKVSWPSTIYARAEKAGKDDAAYRMEDGKWMAYEGTGKYVEAKDGAIWTHIGEAGKKPQILKKGEWVDAVTGDIGRGDQDMVFNGERFVYVQQGTSYMKDNKEQYYDGKDWRQPKAGDTKQDADEKEKIYNGKDWRDARNGDRRKYGEKNQIYNGTGWVDAPAAPALVAGGTRTPPALPRVVPGVPGGKGPEAEDKRTPAERWEDFSRTVPGVAPAIAKAVADNAASPEKIPAAVAAVLSTPRSEGLTYTRFGSPTNEYLLPSGVAIVINRGKTTVTGYTATAAEQYKPPATIARLDETGKPVQVAAAKKRGSTPPASPA